LGKRLKGNKMKFNYIIGNPPYQMPNEKVDSSVKLYDRILKRLDNILDNNGYLSMVTPSKVFGKNSKSNFRILHNTWNPLFVDYQANNYFNVGIDICYWIANKKDFDKIEIITSDGEKINFSEKPDILFKDKKSLDGYSVLKKILRNNKTLKQYPTFKKGNKYKVWMNRNKDKYYFSDDENIIKDLSKIERITLSRSQSLNNIYYDKNSMDVYDSKHFMVPVKNINYQNIIDFYQSDIIRSIAKMYQKVFNLGFQHILLKIDPYLDIDNINNPKEYLKNSFGITEEDIEIIKKF
jgi:hypothetical protein